MHVGVIIFPSCSSVIMCCCVQTRDFLVMTQCSSLPLTATAETQAGDRPNGGLMRSETMARSHTATQHQSPAHPAPLQPSLKQSIKDMCHRLSLKPNRWVSKCKEIFKLMTGRSRSRYCVDISTYLFLYLPLATNSKARSCCACFSPLCYGAIN